MQFWRRATPTISTSLAVLMWRFDPPWCLDSYRVRQRGNVECEIPTSSCDEISQRQSSVWCDGQRNHCRLCRPHPNVLLATNRPPEPYSCIQLFSMIVVYFKSILYKKKVYEHNYILLTDLSVCHMTCDNTIVGPYTGTCISHTYGPIYWQLSQLQMNQDNTAIV